MKNCGSNSKSVHGRCWELERKYEDLCKINFLPSGKLTWLLKMAIYSGFSHEKWWFSIAMLVYQRVQHPTPTTVSSVSLHFFIRIQIYRNHMDVIYRTVLTSKSLGVSIQDHTLSQQYPTIINNPYSALNHLAKQQNQCSTLWPYFLTLRTKERCKCSCWGCVWCRARHKLHHLL